MHSAPLPTWSLWQRVRNEHWPREPAWRVPAAPEPIAVRARIVWDLDGPEWLDGHALRWTADAVMVRLDDPRLGPLATWVVPADVVRADSADAGTGLPGRAARITRAPCAASSIGRAADS